MNDAKRFDLFSLSFTFQTYAEIKTTLDTQAMLSWSIKMNNNQTKIASQMGISKSKLRTKLKQCFGFEYSTKESFAEKTQ